MSTPPTYIILSDSEDEHPAIVPTIAISDSDTDMDDAILNFYDSDDAVVTPLASAADEPIETDEEEEDPSEGDSIDDQVMPENPATLPTPTTEVTGDRVDPDYTPTPDSFVYTDSSKDEPMHEEEEEEEDDSNTASSDHLPTPPTATPALRPYQYVGPLSARGRTRTRANARKSVLVPHSSFSRRDIASTSTAIRPTAPYFCRRHHGPGARRYTTPRKSVRLPGQIFATPTTTVYTNIPVDTTTPDNKRKWGDNSQEPATVKAYFVGPKTKKAYTGGLPYCNMCDYHHTGQCSEPCEKCNKRGHDTKNCWNTTRTQVVQDVEDEIA